MTNNKIEGESEIYRSPFTKHGLITSPDASVRNLQDVIIKSRNKFGD